MWYIYTMEYYSAIKKNAFESVLMRWMKLEPIIQSEVSHIRAPAALPTWAFRLYLLAALYCELTFLRLSSLRVGPAATWVATFIMVLVSLCK